MREVLPLDIFGELDIDKQVIEYNKLVERANKQIYRAKQTFSPAQLSYISPVFDEGRIKKVSKIAERDLKKAGKSLKREYNNLLKKIKKGKLRKKDIKKEIKKKKDINDKYFKDRPLTREQYEEIKNLEAEYKNAKNRNMYYELWNYGNSKSIFKGGSPKYDPKFQRMLDEYGYDFIDTDKEKEKVLQHILSDVNSEWKGKKMDEGLTYDEVMEEWNRKEQVSRVAALKNRFVARTGHYGYIDVKGYNKNIGDYKFGNKG